MKRNLQFFAFLSFALVASNAVSQAVAYVYVANNPKNSSTNQITAFSVAADGKLRVVPGSPFREDVGDMAVNGGHLAAVSQSQPNIDTFAIEPGGALRYLSSVDYSKHAPNHDCVFANQIFFDHTGATLYVQEFNDPVTLEAVNDVEQLTGSLSQKLWLKIDLIERVAPRTLAAV